MRARLLSPAFAVVLLVASAAVPTSAAVAARTPGATPSWSVDPITLTDNDTTLLTGLDCADTVADGTCIAVGSFTDTDQSHHVEVERRGASGWTDVPAPDPSGASDAQLTSISCVSAVQCFAVGRAAHGRRLRTVIEHSAPSGWRLQNPPEPVGVAVSELSGVSCVSSSFCVAVGSTGTSTTRQALIERWDGTSWHLVPAPDSGLPSTQLVAVDCTSPVFCAAVGFAGPSATTTTSAVTETWNGSTWTVGTTRSGDTAEFTAVDCTSATFCLAVGDLSTYQGDYLAGERWDGASWTAADPAEPSGFDARLRGISCTSTTYCLAVGTDDLNPGVGAFARAWTGSAFVTAQAPRPTLLAVRCFTARRCEGAGSGAQFFGGSDWELEATPNHVGAPRDTRLTAVACVGPMACEAVGERYYGGVLGYPLALEWNGASWHSVRDLPDAEISSVNAVACGLDGWGCLSSGYYQPESAQLTLVQSLEGTDWQTVQGVPDIGGSAAISCVPALCVVTGVRAVATFDGTTWRSMPITGPGGADVELTGVDCLSPTDCVVVGGSYGDYPNVESALIERWDGTRWHRVAAPVGRSGRFNALRAVWCASANACVAVGTSHGASDTSLVFRWNGTDWTSVAHPATGGGLNSVACASAGSCAAVGPNGAALTSSHGAWVRSRIAVPPADSDALPDLTSVTYRGGSYHAVGSYERLGDLTAVAESVPAPG